MRLYWVRHAPTGNKNLIGWTDAPADLSDSATLATVRDQLPKDAFIVSSDLSRARATKAAIRTTQTDLPDDSRLREIHFGVWEGKSHEQIAKSHPQQSRDFWTNPCNTPAPMGEDWGALSARVNESVAELIQHAAQTSPKVSGGRDMIIVSHMGPILCQIERARGLNIQQTLALRIEHLSVHCFEQGFEQGFDQAVYLTKNGLFD